MRNSIAGAWLYGIVLVFMSVFIAFISISFNYSNVFQMKSVLTTTIEQNQGVNTNSINAMAGIIRQYGYTGTGLCKEHYIGISYQDLSQPRITKNCGQEPTGKQSICARKVRVASAKTTKYYYLVGAFFGFTLPVVGQIYSFYIEGETNEIYYPSDIGEIDQALCN